jgi:hypothetical protein
LIQTGAIRSGGAHRDQPEPGEKPMPMKTVNDPMDDPRWVQFRKGFEAHGHSLKGLWHASDGIIIWAVSDGPSGPPKHRTIVTRFYEGGGFGVWLESGVGDIDKGVEEVIGTRDFVVMKDGNYLPGTIEAITETEALAKAEALHGSGRYSVALAGTVAANAP